MLDWPQSNERVCPASQRLRDLIVDGKLRHPGDQDLDRAVEIASARQVPRGWRIDRPGGRGARDEPIDPLTALIMASIGHWPRSARSGSWDGSEALHRLRRALGGLTLSEASSEAGSAVATDARTRPQALSGPVCGLRSARRGDRPRSRPIGARRRRSPLPRSRLPALSPGSARQVLRRKLAAGGMASGNGSAWGARPADRAGSFTACPPLQRR